jgi:regulator of protease activity HflC (stomatin/prohibitin superfamily)
MIFNGHIALYPKREPSILGLLRLVVVVVVLLVVAVIQGAAERTPRFGKLIKTKPSNIFFLNLE